MKLQRKMRPKEDVINHRKKTGSLFLLCVTIATLTFKFKKKIQETKRGGVKREVSQRFLNFPQSTQAETCFTGIFY